MLTTNKNPSTKSSTTNYTTPLLQSHPFQKNVLQVLYNLWAIVSWIGSQWWCPIQRNEGNPETNQKVRSDNKYSVTFLSLVTLAAFAVHFSPICKGEVRWMFQHLDLNSDGRLSLQELYDLEHDQSEVCLKPFLQQCDINRDDNVIPAEWCHCFQRTERPCAAVKRKITPNLIGSYFELSRKF